MTLLSLFNVSLLLSLYQNNIFSLVKTPYFPPPFTTKYPYLHPKIFVELIRFFIHMLKNWFLPKASSAYQQLFVLTKTYTLPLISTFSFTPSKKTIIEKVLYALFRFFILMKKARFNWFNKSFIITDRLFCI